MPDSNTEINRLVDLDNPFLQKFEKFDWNKASKEASDNNRQKSMKEIETENNPLKVIKNLTIEIEELKEEIIKLKSLQNGQK